MAAFKKEEEENQNLSESINEQKITADFLKKLIEENFKK